VRDGETCCWIRLSRCVGGELVDTAGSSFAFVGALRAWGARICSGGFCSKDVGGAGARRCDLCDIVFFCLCVCGAFHIYRYS